jgi:hypothetical protein
MQKLLGSLRLGTSQKIRPRSLLRDGVLNSSSEHVSTQWLKFNDEGPKSSWQYIKLAWRSQPKYQEVLNYKRGATKILLPTYDCSVRPWHPVPNEPPLR